MLRLNKEYLLSIILIIIVSALIFINIQKSKPFQLEQPTNILFDKSTNTLSLDSLTLKQKIAQMVITYGKQRNMNVLQNMFIGGIHLAGNLKKDKVIETINNFQETTIPFFVTADLEGCINPFENFKEFSSLKEIKTKEQAYLLGYEQGKLLKELGFNLNFAPVIDLEDTIWNCRNFLGTPEEVSEKANSYIDGLQENNIIATSKHYPGKTLSIKDPHKLIIFASIDEDDLLPFKKTKDNADAIMISHIIVDGAVNSESKPSVVSQKIVDGLRNQFTGLIITDEIRMLGLKKYYSDINEMYIDLFKADNDLILNFDINPKNLYKMISVVEKAVIKGQINENRIDKSVIKILNAKGINVN